MYKTGSPTSPTRTALGSARLAARVTGRRTAGVLAAVALATAGCGTAEAHPPRAGTAPAVQQVSVRDAGSTPCLASADAVQHWSQSAGQSACVLALRERARVRLGLSVRPASASTWVCPTTADATEEWVRAIGEAGCRR
jgi:hypothetical protein